MGLGKDMSVGSVSIRELETWPDEYCKLWVSMLSTARKDFGYRRVDLEHPWINEQIIAAMDVLADFIRGKIKEGSA